MFLPVEFLSNKTKGGIYLGRGRGSTDGEIVPSQDIHPVVGSISSFVCSAYLLVLRPILLPALDSLLPASQNTKLLSKGRACGRTNIDMIKERREAVLRTFALFFLAMLFFNTDVVMAIRPLSYSWAMLVRALRRTQ